MMSFYNNKWRKNNPQKFIFTQKKHSAKKLGVKFDLVFEDVAWPESCPVLGMRLDYGKKKSGRASYLDNSPSFDRLRGELGYTKDNVRIISMRANRIKSDATLKELEALCAYLRRELAP